jgi:hypothetical protein
MKKMVYVGLLAAVLVSLGCAVTNYPVIFDSRGPWEDSVLDGQYDQAYLVPTSQVATFWDDGSDELYTLVTQDWKGDQWLRTYNNFDPTMDVQFLDQTYCDPNHQEDCFIVKAWNPDYPDAYPWNGQDSSNEADDPFDAVEDPACKGYRSLFLLIGQDLRLKECGSSIMADRQNAAFEFALLDRTSFRGKEVYALPVDANVATFTLTGLDGMTMDMPIYGRHELYLDQDLRLAVPMTPNMEYQKEWLASFADAHGDALRVNLKYGSLEASYKVRAMLD